jgi:hypothetical protein
LIVPKRFHAASLPTWTPRVLDLQGNPKLVLLGAGSLAMISETLEELWLPLNMCHLSLESVKDLPGLLAVHFEGNDNGGFEGNDNRFNLGNAIAHW